MTIDWAFRDFKNSYADCKEQDWLEELYKAREADIRKYKGIYLIQRNRFIVYMLIESNKSYFSIRDTSEIEIFKVKIDNDLKDIGNTFRNVMDIIDKLILDIHIGENWYNTKSKVNYKKKKIEQMDELTKIKVIRGENK